MLRGQRDNLRAAGIEERVGANNKCARLQRSKARERLFKIGLATGLHDVELHAFLSRRVL